MMTGPRSETARAKRGRLAGCPMLYAACRSPISLMQDMMGIDSASAPVEQVVCRIGAQWGRVSRIASLMILAASFPQAS